MENNFTLFLTGKARVKKNTTEDKLFQFITIGVEIDLPTELILAAECTLCNNLEIKFITNLLKGKKLTDEGFLEIYNELNLRIHGTNKSSVLTALNDLKCNWDR
ncbi:MAG: DUF3870 domain-containing protein [Peptococcaceae bacterium]